MSYFLDDATLFIYLSLIATIFLGIAGVSLVWKGRRSGIGLVLFALLWDVAGAAAAFFDCLPWNWHTCR
jgi:hypothetical protein